VRILLVEPWCRGSHRAWADGWAATSSHDIDMVTLPDRFWRRRLRVGAVELAPLVDRWVEAHGRPDVVVATSMVDLAALLGSCRRSLSDAPVVLYCHESQLVYPHPDQVAAPDVDAAAHSLQSLTVADRVVVVVEAMAAGCVTVLPDRCSYPELVPAEIHHAALYPEGGFGRRLRRVLVDLPAARAAVEGLSGAMTRFDRDAVSSDLDAVVARVAVPRHL
jgi:hypothetical protein